MFILRVIHRFVKLLVHRIFKKFIRLDKKSEISTRKGAKMRKKISRLLVDHQLVLQN